MKFYIAFFFSINVFTCAVCAQDLKSKFKKLDSIRDTSVRSLRYVAKPAFNDPFVMLMPRDSLNRPVKMPNGYRASADKAVLMPTYRIGGGVVKQKRSALNF